MSLWTSTFPWMDPERIPRRRGHWWPKSDFFFTFLSLTFNVRFLFITPFLMMSTGRGLYVIAYVILLILVVYPLVNLGLSLGQFSASGVISAWNICPLMKGIGYGSALMSTIHLVYSSYLAAWPLHYLASTILSSGNSLPWSSCSNPWNTDNCSEINANQTLAYENYSGISLKYNISLLREPYSSPAEEYFRNRFLASSNDTHIGNLGAFQWELLTSLTACWILIYLVLIVGHYSLGKVSYITTLLPVGITIALVIQSVALPGAKDGLYYIFIVMVPDLTQLIHIITSAHLNIVHDFFLAFGCYHMLGSYNRFTYNYNRDSAIVVLCALMFLGLCTLLTGCLMGHYAYLRNSGIGELTRFSGPGFLYTVVTEVLSTFAMPKLWLCFFFTSVFLTACGSEMVVVESVVTAIADEFFPPGLTKGRRMLFKSLLTLAFCLSVLLLGLPLVTQGGPYVFMLLYHNATAWAPLVLSVLACMTVIWLYGLVRYAHDVKMMIGHKPDYLILGSLLSVVPIEFLCCLTLRVLFYTSPISYVGYGQAGNSWLIPVSWVVAMAAIAMVPIFMVVRLLQAAICPKRCSTPEGAGFCARVAHPTRRWQSQYPQEHSQRRTIIQSPSRKPSAPRPEISAPIYLAIKETEA